MGSFSWYNATGKLLILQVLSKSLEDLLSSMGENNEASSQNIPLNYSLQKKPL